VRCVEDITQALWGRRVSASTVSDLNQRIYKQIEEWRHRPLEGEFSYVFVDGLLLKRSWGGEVKNVSVLVAIGVAKTSYRQILAVSEGAKEDKASWTAFLHELKKRGLKGVKLFVSDKGLDTDAGSRSPTKRCCHEVGYEALSADEAAGQGRGHRLTACSGPMGARANQLQPNNLPKSQARSKVRKNLATTHLSVFLRELLFQNNTLRRYIPKG
jgi:Transposase, Mutator family